MPNHAGHVQRFQANVVRIRRFFNRAHIASFGVHRGLKIFGEIRQLERAGQIENIAHDGARRGELACAGARQHDFADRAAIDENRVVHAFDSRQRMMQRHQHRMRADIHFAAVANGLREADHLDAIAEFVGELNVEVADLRDALPIDFADFDGRLKGERGENRNLVHDVVAFDIVGRIGFGIAFCLGFAQGFGERLFLLLHHRQNVVRRAVDDACDFGDSIRLQAALHRRNQRDAAADRRFKKYRDIVFVGRFKNLRAVFGDHFFVGGDNVFAVGDRAFDDFVNLPDAARDFDDDFDAGIVGQRKSVVGDVKPGEINFARFGFIAHGNGADFKLRMVAQQFDYPRADCAET